jgi:phosphoribosylaminoimidazolecarboxamide formyltransferase/IMP cyclohydrolase
MNMLPVQRALLSVSDKTGIVELAQALIKKNIEILSTGGTAKALTDAGIKVTSIDSYTKHPEIMDGRVKTLHPRVHGGILAVRDNPVHQKAMDENGILQIDMVVVNLYPFKKTIEKPDVTIEDAIENIDIGGPAMVRSAAKNHHYVTVIVDPADYNTIIIEMAGGGISLETRKKLAVKAFRHTSAYDAAIDEYFSKVYTEENVMNLRYVGGTTLRYGENPHQSASFYISPAISEPGVCSAVQIHGKELSYNNIVDADAAFEVVKEFQDSIAVAVIKHTNPCGLATGKTAAEALEAAWSGDPVSAYGGIIALSTTMDIDAAKRLEGRFVEIVIAPDFTSDAVTFLQAKSNAIRLLKTGGLHGGNREKKVLKHVVGGLLVQDRDDILFEKWETVTTSNFQKNKEKLAIFAWKACKHIKSNAIVLAREYINGFFKIEGMGAGQPNRIDSFRKLSVLRAKENLLAEYTSSGKIVPSDEVFPEFGEMVMASDAFFPFADTIEVANSMGIRYIVQPGGSKRDNDVIEACNRFGIAMVFTGTRHFRH